MGLQANIDAREQGEYRCDRFSRRDDDGHRPRPQRVRCFPELETPRLRLRSITLEDAPFWVRNFSDSEVVELTAYEPPEDLPRALAPTGRANLLVPGNQEEVWETAEARFRVRVLASKALFFESLHILELRHRVPD